MKKFLKYGFLFLLLTVVILGYIFYPRLNIITGFAAKNVCSCVFEAGREPESVRIGDNDFAPVRYADNDINFSERTASSNVFGLKERTAIHLPGMGCTLLPDDSSAEKLTFGKPNRISTANSFPYPYGNGEVVDTIFSNIDYTALDNGVESAFDAEGEDFLRTRAVVILYKGKLIAEKYAPGFTKETKILGWSMAKSITSAVLGVLEKQGRISPSQDHLFALWNNDDRAEITLDDLLRMSSSLEWDEDYTKISDVTRMLFLEENMPEVQLQKRLIAPPGTVWNYSSGTSNLLSGFIRKQFETHQEYLDFWYREFIDRIGMHSMTIEPDPAGNYVGSSYAWATPRDWAKFGLLYLNKGNWNGEQILNESWVDYTTTPTTGSGGEYGAHFWLNSGGKYPNVPRDLFSANGFQGQYVFIIPSQKLIVVRFGLKEEPDFNVDTFLKNVLTSIN